MHALLPLALLAALPACTGPVPAQYARVLPDDRLEVNLPEAGARRDGDVSQYYLMTRQVTDGVNGLIGGVLGTVDQITELPPSWSNDEAATAVWGPWSQPLDAVQTLLTVHHDLDADTWTWAIVERPKASTHDADWVPIVAGQVDAGATEVSSSGFFAIDFDQAAALDPAQTASGTFATEYSLFPDGAEATAGFQDYSDGNQTVNAYYHYAQVPASVGQMDLAFPLDVNGNGTDESEYVRSRWVDTGAGRADAYVTGGDLGSLVANATECWDTSFASVYYTDNFGGTTTGDPNACVYDQPDYTDEGP